MTRRAAMAQPKHLAYRSEQISTEGRAERGFTLLETVIAMIVMMTVGLGASALFLYSITNNSAAAARAQSLAVAQQEMERLRSVAFDDPLLNPTGNAPVRTTVITGGNAGADVTDSSYTFNVTKTIVAQNNSTTKLITLAVTPVIRNAPWAAGAVTITTARATPKIGSN
jgi:Tfp pilus assembly protein PilV